MKSTERGLKIAYLFILFPKLTETFNLREMLKLQEYDAQIEVFSLLAPEAGAVSHPESEPLAAKTYYCPWLFSRRLWAANINYLLQQPGIYLKTLFQLARHTLSKPVLCGKTIATFFKSAYFSQLCEEQQLDHIHATFASHNTTAALVISALSGIEFSFTIDAYDLYVETSLLRLKLEKAAFVTTISNFNLQVIEERYGQKMRAKTSCIYRGIDLQRYCATNTASPRQNFTLLCTASLNRKKGHRYLLQAIAELRRQNRNLSCVIAGDGPLRQELTRLAKSLEITDCVEFAGALTQEQVISRLQQADCFVLPSIIGPGNRMEGIPNALMEASACELPVISTRISGIPELVE